MMQLKDKKVLVTGGTEGIGKALVAGLVARGVKQIAVMARKKKGLDALGMAFPSTEFIMIMGDVSDLDNIRHGIEKIKSQWGYLDILVNNAGVVSAGLLENIPDEDIVSQIAINLTGPIVLTKYCLPLLKESKGAAIMNISSGLGLIGMPYYSVYASTKSGIRQFSDALRRELKSENIHVISIYPTATDTGMMKTADTTGMDAPEMVAEKSIEGLINGEINVIFGGEQRLRDHRLNFEAPLEMDRKVAGNLDVLKKRSARHRAM